MNYCLLFILLTISSFFLTQPLLFGTVLTPTLTESTHYQQKSIASIDQMLIFSDPKNLINPITFKEQLAPYIELDRFEQNTMPPELSNEFITAFYTTQNRSIKTLSHLIETIYVPTIITILEDPAIQESRINQFKTKDYFTFESTKGNSFSVTAKDLKKLFSSSFFTSHL